MKNNESVTFSNILAGVFVHCFFAVGTSTTAIGDQLKMRLGIKAPRHRNKLSPTRLLFGFVHTTGAVAFAVIIALLLAAVATAGLTFGVLGYFRAESGQNTADRMQESNVRNKEPNTARKREHSSIATYLEANA